MKRTLIINRNLPLAANSGSKIRTMNFVNFFNTLGDVDICHFDPNETHADLDHHFSKHYRLVEEDRHGSFKRKFIAGLIRNAPVPVYPWSRSNIEMAKKIIAQNKYDYILVRYIQNAHILLKLNKDIRSRAIIDFDDQLSGSLYDLRFRNVKSLLGKGAVKINKHFLQKFETFCLKIGTSIFSSELDQACYHEALNGYPSFVVPNICPSTSLINTAVTDGFKNGNVLLFIGTLNYKPNVEGLTWFLNEIYPEFQQHYDDAKLIVVGRAPQQRILSMCSDNPSVQIHSNVKEVRPFYDQCRAVVVPLLSGGGTRIKIIEAAMYNRPVISTVKGAEGLKFKKDKSLLLFGEKLEFSAQYDKLTNPATYGSLVKHAKLVVDQSYSEKEFGRKMRPVIDYSEKKSGFQSK